jgi:hypothetical protein
VCKAKPGPELLKVGYLVFVHNQELQLFNFLLQAYTGNNERVM